MATTTSGVHAWLNALADALEARPAIDDQVLVTTGYVADVDGRDAITLADSIDGEQEWGLLGNRRRDEKFTMGGVIWVKRAGKGEAVIRTVRERAWALLAEVEDELRVRPDVTGTVKVAAITRYTLDQGPTSDGRWCQIDFEIRNWKDLPS